MLPSVGKNISPRYLRRYGAAPPYIIRDGLTSYSLNVINLRFAPARGRTSQKRFPNLAGVARFRVRSSSTGLRSLLKSFGREGVPQTSIRGCGSFYGH